MNSYRLYRLDGPGADACDGMLLGEYDTFEDALDARDDDTAALFAATPTGTTLVACHQIVGCAPTGAMLDACPVATRLPRPDGVAGDVADTREWLRRVHSPAPSDAHE